MILIKRTCEICLAGVVVCYCCNGAGWHDMDSWAWILLGNRLHLPQVLRVGTVPTQLVAKRSTGAGIGQGDYSSLAEGDEIETSLMGQ